jgi:hypothetical protein
MKKVGEKRIAAENDIIFQLLKNKMEMEIALQRNRYLSSLATKPFTCAWKGQAEK